MNAQLLVGRGFFTICTFREQHSHLKKSPDTVTFGRLSNLSDLRTQYQSKRTQEKIMASITRQKQVDPVSQPKLYQYYPTDEDTKRINVHYEQPSRFFELITGGEWNVYSCNLWDKGAATETASQEAKLDMLAELMELKQGQRILDVGCGWGGPLVYLCKKYGLQGVGVTTSATQKRTAEERIARHGVDAHIVETHWRDFRTDLPFDAVYTDEVIVHFSDLDNYFKKVWSVLRDGGRMLNKELHFTHRKYSEVTRAMSLVNEIYGSTGNYRTLAQELTIAGDAGFEIEKIAQIPLSNYCRTLDYWLENMETYKGELEALVSPEYYRRFRTYLKIVRRSHTGHTMTLDVVVSHKVAGSDVA